MTIRTLLVDDEPAALRGLSRRLQTEKSIEVIGLCEDGAAAIAAITELKPDLVFLDIQMPGINGFEVIDAIGLANTPAIIFVTAYNQYAVRAFDVHAIDYLLKPIDNERFQLALERARQHVLQPREKMVKCIAEMLEKFNLNEPHQWSKRLAIKQDGRIVLVESSDVDRIEAAGNYVEVYVGTKMHLMRETLIGLGGRLNPDFFARVSRSSIVNIEHVRELQPMFNGDFVVILHNGAQVKGSRKYRAALDALIS